MNLSSRVGFLLFPAGVLAGWVALASGVDARGLAVCRHRESDGQDARLVDLGRVDREYTRMAKSFRERLKTVEEKTLALRDRGHDSGVKACTRPGRRTVPLENALPPKLRGRRLFFVAALEGGRHSSGLPELLPSDIVFLTRYASLLEAGAAAQRLNVGVTPATGALVERLGIRCTSSVVKVSQDGKTLAVEEIPE